MDAVRGEVSGAADWTPSQDWDKEENIPGGHDM